MLAVAASEREVLVAGLDRDLSVVIPVAASQEPAAELPAAMDLIDEALRRADLDGADVQGVVVSFSDKSIASEFSRQAAGRASLPVLTVPFAQAAMEGERLQGAAIGRTSALLFDTDALEVSLVLNGALYRGGFGQAGRVAHLGLDRTGSLHCRCGQVGCLTALMAAGDQAPKPPLPADSRPLPSHRLGWVAVALIALLNTVNPEVLILGGSGVADSDEFAWLGDAVRSGCLAPTRAGLVEIARGCRDRALVGAASLAFLGQTSALLEPG
jgi:predicted NBD/HSP70 family sugar kinase